MSDTIGVGPERETKRYNNRDEIASSVRRERYAIRPDGSVVPPRVTPPDFSRPPDVGELMRRLGWCDNEPAADIGHLRMYPSGTLVFRLVQEWHRRVLSEQIEAIEIMTPAIFRWQNAVQDMAGTFADRIYFVADDVQRAQQVLRFGGDAGLFNMLADARLTYRQLPLRLYEFCPSFRRNRSGEVTNIRRGRSFSFYDSHSLCADANSAWEEYERYFALHVRLSQDIGMEYDVEVTGEAAFLERHPERLARLATLAGVEIDVVRLSARTHYWSMKHVFISKRGEKYFNLQYDAVNAARYGIGFADARNSRAAPLILHNALSSVERWMYMALLDATLAPERGLPFWLNPVQLRLIPIKSDDVGAVCRFAEQLSGVRVEVDNRAKPLGWRMRAAKDDYCAYVAAYGQREDESQRVELVARDGTRATLGAAAIDQLAAERRGPMPYLPLRPLRTTERVRFA